MPKTKEKATAAPAAIPAQGGQPSPELVHKFQAFLVSLDTLSNATQTASYAANQYFNALYPNSGLPEPSFFGFNRAAVNSAVAGAVSQGADDAAEEDGNPAKRRKRSKPAVPKDPNAPKKPLTAYFAFAKKTRPEVAAHLPGASNKEITDELALRWNNMKDTGEQQPFRDQYALDMKGYTTAAAKYKAKLSGAVVEEVPEEEEEEVVPEPPKPVTPKATKGKKAAESATKSGRKGKEKEKPAAKGKSRKSTTKEVTPPPSAGEEEQPVPATKSPRKRKRKD